MSDLDVYLYPALVALTLASLAAFWQSRHAREDIDARKRIMERRFDLKRWQAMSQWGLYRTQQDDPVRHARAARRRAGFFALCACVVAAFLCLWR